MSTGSLLLIDNYDSFAHNLARYFRRLGQEVNVVRNDTVDVTAVRRLAPKAIVLSPGPCHPADAGCSVEVVRAFSKQLPILGVCLGHQAIVTAFGGRVVRSPSPMHGRASAIYHDGLDLFANVPEPFRGCRYHSLTADRRTIPDELRVSATTDDGVIMAIQHRDRLTTGLQFHPESILTEHGYQILDNFLRLAGLRVAARRPSHGDELTEQRIGPARSPGIPVTF